MATLTEIIEKIKIVSNLDADSQVLIELILPEAINRTVEEMVKDPQQINALRATTSLTFASGVATLPDNIKEEYGDTIHFVGTSGLESYAKQWIDYSQSSDTLFPKFTVQNKNIYYRAAGQPISTYSGTLTIDSVVLPTLPSSASSTVDIKPNILEKIVHLAAQMVAEKYNPKSLN